MFTETLKNGSLYSSSPYGKGRGQREAADGSILENYLQSSSARKKASHQTPVVVKLAANTNSTRQNRFSALFSSLFFFPMTKTLQIAGVQRDGARTFRTYFKVSAVIPLDPNNSKTGGGVGIVANLYRVSGEVPKEKGGLDGAGVPNLLVVLRRKKGDYFR